jgi:DNA repair protein RecO (recombination protein O)
MHAVHIYDGIVLGRRGVREADLLVDVLTPMGLVRALARSARAEKSKLRYGLQPLTRGRYSFVRGRHEWRLTGVTDVSRDYLSMPPDAQAAAARVSRLLLRLVAGQEPSPELFSTASEGFDALAKSATVQSAVQALEAVLVLRILSCLGYLPHTDALAPFVEGEFSLELSAKALEARGLLIKTINESLRATGL